MIRARNQAQGQKDSSKKISICVSRGFASEEDTMPHSISASCVRQGLSLTLELGWRPANTSNPVSTPTTHLERVCLCVQQAIHGCL